MIVWTIKLQSEFKVSGESWKNIQEQDGAHQDLAKQMEWNPGYRS